MDRARGIRPFLLLLVMAASGAACGTPDLPSIEADADLVGADAGDLGAGLSLRFRPSPGVQDPIAIDGVTFSLREARVHLSDLRLIGDAATGDDRTRIDLVKLEWLSDSGPLSSAGYPDAPPGLYSLVRGGITRFEFYVDVEQSDGADVLLEIEYEDSPVAIDFAIDYKLEAGAPLELEVVLDLAGLYSLIAVDQLEVDDGKIEIDNEENTGLLNDLSESLSQAFSVQQVL